VESFRSLRDFVSHQSRVDGGCGADVVSWARSRSHTFSPLLDHEALLPLLEYVSVNHVRVMGLEQTDIARAKDALRFIGQYINCCRTRNEAACSQSQFYLELRRLTE
jgi:hypothetical protein